MSPEMLLGLANWVPVAGIIGLAVALNTYLEIKRLDRGTDQMKRLAKYVHDGAMVFLKKEYLILSIFIAAVFLSIIIFIDINTSIAYLAGALSSMLAGFFGMKSATRSAVRTTQAAKTGGLPAALNVAFNGGSVMGLSVGSLGILGVGLMFVLYIQGTDVSALSGFAMGASSIALFARIGGGIFTKSADVGADLVGKVEKDIPEDDPRNPATIADNVGDNVGDIAGMGADLYESFVGSIIAAIAIGAALSVENPENFMALPLLLAGIGLIASIIGILSMFWFKKISPEWALRLVPLVGGIIFFIGSYLVIDWLTGSLALFWVVVLGLVAGLLIGIVTEWYTSGRPTHKVAESSETGTATLIISGFATGLESVAAPLVLISSVIFASYNLGEGFLADGGGLYAIALAAVGMLATIGVTMSVDAYGPIADNAGGIAEMSGAGDDIREITDNLDAIGNTTAAIGKGFAIGSAALTALALFSAYSAKVAEISGAPLTIDITEPNVVIGLFAGAVVAFLLGSTTMKSVGRAAMDMVNEVRRQFKEIDGLYEGTAEADHGRCIDIATNSALREMIVPGLMAVGAPLAIGFSLGPDALGGLLAGATITGVTLAILMANSGAIWDNAKKYIEMGHHGGKGSKSHKAAIVGDTVGDPFKDTSGPAMNILIKLMSIVSLVFAPVIVRMWM